VILSQCNEEHSVLIADRVVANFNGKNTQDCSLSIGLAEYLPDEDADFEPFIHRADAAMYAAKKIKGNAIVRYSQLHPAS
jgi:GGDEF domain-containing protein